MMAREVNLFVNNWQATGKNISVPQYSDGYLLKTCN